MEKSPIAVFITDTHLSESTIEINFNIFTQLFILCEELGINIIYHGGDIFTSRKGQSEIVLNAFKNILDIAAEKKLKIVAIAGNHDKTDYNSQSSYLDAFDGHPAFSVVSPLGATIVGDGNTIIHMLPYYDETLSYFDKLNELNEQVDGEHRNILLTHIAIDGVKNNSGSAVENKIFQTLFDKFDLVLVGHYHNRQILGRKKNIIYTGSGYQANFGEDAEKGCTIIYDDATEEFFKLEFPEYVTINVLASDIDRTVLSKVKKAKEEGNNKLRFRVVGEVEESKQSLLVELQTLAKVEVMKEEYKPTDVIHGDSVIINDIMKEFDDWSTARQIADLAYGREILGRNIS